MKTVEILHSHSAYEPRKPYMSKTEVIYSRSAYGSDKKNMSKEKTEEFKYPVVYSTPLRGPTIWFSSTNKKGHYGVSKLILNPRQSIGYVVDKKGQYGMTQFCIGIVGDSDYLDMVENVIIHQKTNGFREIMEACHFGDQIFDMYAISSFRKDFWKEFI